VSEIELMPCQCSTKFSHPEIQETEHFVYVNCARCGMRGPYAETEEHDYLAPQYWNELQAKLSAFERASAVLEENRADVGDARLYSEKSAGENWPIMRFSRVATALSAALEAKHE
jgi:hypothetical protein